MVEVMFERKLFLYGAAGEPMFSFEFVLHWLAPSRKNLVKKHFSSLLGQNYIVASRLGLQEVCAVNSFTLFLLRTTAEKQVQHD